MDPAPNEPPIAPGPRQGAILLVDDEAPLLALYAEVLGSRFEVYTANSVGEASALMRKHEFKVVVSDHLMPGGNGLNLLVTLRNEYPATQRVLLTGYMKPEMLLRCANEAALYRYLLKPVAVRELVKTVVDAAELFDQNTVQTRS
jgi:two-component system response regulator HupR/HoxA